MFADAALPAPPKTTTAYDGLGRVRTATAGDVVTTPAYGTGGAETGTSMQPAENSPYQGRKFTAEQSLDLSGGSVHKVLTQGEGEQAESRGGTRNVLDLAGRVRVQMDQLGNTTTLVHTKDGQIASSVTRTPGRDGQDGTLVSQTANTYDQATGRLVSTTVTSADGTALTRSMRHDKLGRVTEVWEGTPKDGQDKTDAYTKSVIGYGYDADGNTTTVTYPDGTTLTQAFDQARRMVKSTDGAGAVTDYTYHPQTGRLEKAVQKAKDGTELASAAYTYDTLGRLESVRHGNKTTTRYEYFDNDQPKTQTLTRDDGGEVLARTAYTYNSHGNLETRTDTRPAVNDDGTLDTDGGGGNVTTHTVHTYDAYDRLIRTVLHDGPDTNGRLVKQTDYTINASGDITHTKTTNADGTVSETVNEIDAAGRRTTVTTGDVKAEQAWDPAGNLTRDRHGTTITYNPDNKPVTLTPTQPGQATVAVAYWADGSRRSATTTDREGTEQTTTYHYTPTGTLANDTTAGLTASYLTTPQGREHRTLTHNGTPTPADDRAGTGYLMADRRGNTTALADHEGKITHAYYYEDYGRPTTHHTTPLTPNPQTDRAHTNPIQYGGEYTNTCTTGEVRVGWWGDSLILAWRPWVMWSCGRSG
ncbi:RHS repeat domain-containing protein, partial [Streptomyces sp. NPDC001817]|uniref:RHS repeat domain-containing protein n=1 Tax=Streptomyces sp. NPDC001817 TaxID=3154398 RepID=UPI00332DBFDC